MKKIIILLMLSVILLCFAQENEKNYGDIGFELAIPTGDFSEFAGNGIGASLKGYHAVTSNVDISIKFAYIYYLTHERLEDWGIDMNVFEMPFMLGARYKIPNQGVYGTFEVGGVMYGVIYGDDYLTDREYTDMAFSLGFGYIYNVFDFSATYFSIVTENDNSNHFGFRIAYILK